MSYYIIYVSFQTILNNLVWKPGCGDGLPIACHVSEACGVNSHKPVELSDVFNSLALQRWHWLNKNRTLETQVCDGLWGLSPNTRKIDKNLALELEVLAEAKQDIQPGRLHF